MVWFGLAWKFQHRDSKSIKFWRQKVFKIISYIIYHNCNSFWFGLIWYGLVWLGNFKKKTLKSNYIDLESFSWNFQAKPYQTIPNRVALMIFDIRYNFEHILSPKLYWFRVSVLKFSSQTKPNHTKPNQIELRLWCGMLKMILSHICF